MKVLVILTLLTAFFVVTFSRPQSSIDDVASLVYEGGPCPTVGLQRKTLAIGWLPQEICTCQSHQVLWGARYSWGACTEIPSNTTTASPTG